MKTPWQYAETGNEFSHQVALFQWAAMAERFGNTVAMFPAAYTEKGWAINYRRDMERTGNQDEVLPQLRWLYAIKNQGHGDKVRGSNSAAEGVKAGVADTELPVCRYEIEGGQARLIQTGLYIEMKRPASKGKPAGKPSELQEQFRDFVQSEGREWHCCYGWLEARDVLLAYLGVS